MNKPTFSLLLVSSLLGAPAWAHKPAFGPGYDSPESAYEIEDNDVSIVVYQTLSCEEPELWLTFDAVAGEELWVQLGVPEVDRLEDYRPTLVVFAPGLPALEGLPFEAPDGLGGVVFDSAEVDAPSEFYEPFTRTSSWVWFEEWVETPESGTGYVVAFEPDGWTGKAWVAAGTVEDFSDVDFAEMGSWDEEVNDFHETGKYYAPDEVVEEQCGTDDAAGEDALGEDEAAADSAGCEAVTAAGSMGWVWLVGLLGLKRRRPGLGDWLVARQGHDSARSSG